MTGSATGNGACAPVSACPRRVARNLQNKCGARHWTVYSSLCNSLLRCFFTGNLLTAGWRGKGESNKPLSGTDVNEDSGLTYDVSSQFASMSGGAAMVFSLAEGTPDWVHIDSNTGVISGTPVNENVGVINITVIGTDQAGSQAHNTLQINSAHQV